MICGNLAASESTRTAAPLAPAEPSSVVFLLHCFVAQQGLVAANKIRPICLELGFRPRSHREMLQKLAMRIEPVDLETLRIFSR